MSEQLSKEATALIMQYTNGKGLAQAQSHHSDFQLSSNGRARVQEMVQRSGLTREQAQQDPGILKAATLKALAEQRGQPPMNTGIDGRNGLNASTGGVRVGRSLAEIANSPATGDE